MYTEKPPRLVRITGKPNWHIYHDRQRISTRTEDRAEAEAELARYIAILNTVPTAAEGLTVEKLLAAYLNNREKRIGINVTKDGVERLRYAHKPLGKFFGLVTGITKNACVDYRNARREHGVGDRTIHAEISALSTALRWGMENDVGLVEKMPSLEWPTKGQGRDAWLTRQEADALLASCTHRHVKLFVTLALNTGARHRAILGLTWDRVDLEFNILDYRTPDEIQTRKRKVACPINSVLRAALVEAKALATSPYVIEWDGSRVGSVKHGFASARKAAGLPDTVTPHTLRHTAVSWLIQAGVSTDLASQLTGMTQDVCRRIYTHSHPDALRETAERLGQRSTTEYHRGYPEHLLQQS